MGNRGREIARVSNRRGIIGRSTVDTLHLMRNRYMSGLKNCLTRKVWEKVGKGKRGGILSPTSLSIGTEMKVYRDPDNCKETIDGVRGGDYTGALTEPEQHHNSLDLCGQGEDRVGMEKIYAWGRKPRLCREKRERM